MLSWLKKHYHWIIAIVLLLEMAIHGGAANNLSGVHLIPVTEALDLTRTQYSLGNSVKSVVGVFGTLITGSLLMHYGFRKMATVGLTVSAVAYLLFYKMDSYWMFLAGNALLGLANGVCTVAGVSRIVSSWFHKHRGMVLGLVTATTGVGGSLLSILQTSVMERFSWRASYMLVATLMLAIAVLIYSLVRNFPEDMGLQAYGDAQQHVAKKGKSHEDLWDGFTMTQLSRKPAFYMMLTGVFISTLCLYIAFSYVLPHMQDRGLSLQQASMTQSIMLLLLSASKFGAGTLCDWIGPKKVVLISSACTVVGLCLLATTDGMTSAVISVVIYSMGLPLTTVLIPLLATSLFGYRAQPQYTGIFMSMVSAASIVSGPVSNAVYDRMASYSPAFIGAAALAVGNILLYLILYRMAAKDRKVFEQKV